MHLYLGTMKICVCTYSPPLTQLSVLLYFLGGYHGDGCYVSLICYDRLPSGTLVKLNEMLKLISTSN